MTRRVAITRALPEAMRTADNLRALGAEPVLAPLLTIAPQAFEADLADVQALLFTSANGVRAFADAIQARHLRVLAVGDATAAEARNAGFPQVQSAAGDSEALAALAIEALNPQAGRVLHITGDHVAGDVVGALTKAGFTAERRIAYNSVAATQLPSDLAGEIDTILFHSARAAEIFVSFGAPRANHLIAACLSPAVARAACDSPVGSIAWAHVIVSPHPREDALLRAVLASAGASA
jgi:uroporphyrinogen-III synthase